MTYGQWGVFSLDNCKTLNNAFFKRKVIYPLEDFIFRKRIHRVLSSCLVLSEPKFAHLIREMPSQKLTLKVTDSVSPQKTIIIIITMESPTQRYFHHKHWKDLMTSKSSRGGRFVQVPWVQICSFSYIIWKTKRPLLTICRLFKSLCIKAGYSDIHSRNRPCKSFLWSSDCAVWKHKCDTSVVL